MAHDQQDRFSDSALDANICYQCAKCSAGCPIAPAMDDLPHRVLKMVQIGMRQEALKSATIWLCAGCLTCAVRCPMQIDLPRVMDDLKQQAIAEGVQPGEPRVAAFYREFLASVRRHGRVHELTQLLSYKLQARDFVGDVDLGVKLLAQGQLKLKPESIQQIEQIKKLFDEFS